MFLEQYAIYHMAELKKKVLPTKIFTTIKIINVMIVKVFLVLIVNKVMTIRQTCDLRVRICGYG